MKQINQYPGLWWYISAVLVLYLGIVIAAQKFPDGFDWQYTVASALASHRYNPDGNIWYAGGFGLSMALHWPYISALKEGLDASRSSLNRFALFSIRVGLASGILIGIEGVFIRDLAQWVTKGHEVLAIFAFLGLYLGLLIFLVQAMTLRIIYGIPALLVTVPLIAIGVTQFWLWITQRDIGWLNIEWREMGIPVWLSFAFWQWLAIVFLTIGLGALSLIGRKRTGSL
ncbi:MAG: hypothetical protein AMJ68_02710 [Acidithiobacillales bacterium SG8_45]|jgi:hypothetical protein|nr:MAG: hypothetical protein AMJ68_02710 [Acidithiobacillales bacterium SG8_45]